MVLCQKHRVFLRNDVKCFFLTFQNNVCSCSIHEQWGSDIRSSSRDCIPMIPRSVIPCYEARKIGDFGYQFRKIWPYKGGKTIFRGSGGGAFSPFAPPSGYATDIVKYVYRFYRHFGRIEESSLPENSIIKEFINVLRSSAFGSFLNDLTGLDFNTTVCCSNGNDGSPRICQILANKFHCFVI